MVVEGCAKVLTTAQAFGRLGCAMRDTRTTPRTRGFVIDLGSDITDGRYIVTKDFSPTASVLDVLEGRSGQILYRGDDRAEANRVRETA